MDTILIVEDEKTLRYSLKNKMEDHGFLVMDATNGKRLLDIIEYHTIDLILLNLELPDGNGLNFIDDIRNHTNAPIIIMAIDSDNNKKIDGFDRGADDYVVKPFDLNVMIHRIKAHLRRYKKIETNQQKDKKIHFSNWILDPSQFQICNKDGQYGDLTSREFYLLYALLKNAGRAIPRQELCDSIREDNYVPTPRAIDVKITRIRKKINDNALSPNIIKTIRGVGYMMNKDIINH